MRIKKFENFTNNKTLYIFDFDDTLAKSPSFEELAIDFLKEDLTIEDLLKSSVDRIGVKLSDLKWENGRIFIDDLEKEVQINGNWVRKGPRVYITSPHVFPFTEMSMPDKLKDLAKLYLSVDDKCIVTARPEDVREKITETLSKLGLHMPKFGLHMFPAMKGAGNPGFWKGRKIVEILKETGFQKAHFFDDNSKVVNKVDRIVKEEMPYIDWKSTKVLK
jgi:hypothetical protein